MILKNLERIKEVLEKVQNPLFFFDNDVDGLASFLLLRKFCQKGKGVAIKSYPGLNVSYVRKLYELNPDYIFVLDKPMIEKGFIEKAKELVMPIVWIDHHGIPKEVEEYKDNIFYFNPKAVGMKETPVSFICYQITKQKENEWIALLGCLADWYVPDFAKEFSKAFPDLFPFTPDPAKALYETEIGKLVKVLTFALMDRTTKVVKMLKNLLLIKNPYELLEENKLTASIHKRFKQINRKYEKMLKKAKKIAEKSGKLIFFKYGGETSFSAQIANELFYLYPNKIIAVACVKGNKVNVSLRGKNVLKITLEALSKIEGKGGGHKDACGAALKTSDLQKFHENLLMLIK